MKKVLAYIPIILSLVVLGAHFMRYGNEIGVIGSLALIALLFLRRRWVARLVQVALVLGALEWLHTLYQLMQLRITLDQPFTRMAIILGAIAAVTACSSLLFQLRPLKAIYQLDNNEQVHPSGSKRL
jgi:hypothetical protein